MASIVVAGDTSGSITLAAPAIAGSNTLTLPTQTATLATLTTPSFATTIGVGGATPSTSGAGITFPATQSASTDANTLDDYEEGTFTPTFITDGTNPTVTYGAQNGRYVKVGSLVYCSANLRLTNLSSAGTGSLFVGGLPFAVLNQDFWYIGSIGYFASFTGRAPRTVMCYGGRTQIELWGYGSTALDSGSDTRIASTNLTSTTDFWVSITYRAT